MSKKNTQNSLDGLVGPRVLLSLRLLGLVALGVSVYLSWVALTGGALAGCGPESGCDHVLQSRWSKWLGLPVSLFGVVIYGGLLLGTLWLDRKTPPAQQRNVWLWLVPGAVMVIGSVLWFVGLQLVVIKQVCRFCMVVHACGLASAFLIIKQAPFRNPPDKAWQIDKQVFVPPGRAKLLALAALAGVAALVAGQVLYTPRMYLVKNVEPGKLTPVEHIFQIYDGQFQFNLNEAPLIGKPEAPRVMLSLFDYTCKHCREMHPLLLAAQKTFGNELAIVNLPMPLDSKCNSLVRMTPPPHVNACEYARLGLAVWRAKREAHHTFEEWLFAPETPPSLDAARQYAANLLGGTNALEQALGDAWVARQLQQSIAFYSTNYLQKKRGEMPQMLIGTNLYFSSMNRIEDLYRELANQLGLSTNRAPAGK